MKDTDKTKAQLIAELEELKKQLKEVKESYSNVSQVDITESEKKFRLLAENTPGIIIVYDIDENGNRHTVYFSPGLENILKSDFVPEIVNDINNYIRLIHPDDIADFQSTADKSQDSESVFDYEYRVRVEEEKYRWVHSVAKAVKRDNGLIRWYCRIYDITERRNMEQALAESEERFRRLAENASDMIYRMSLPDGNYEYISPASKTIFGYSPQDFFENPMLILEIIAPGWHPYFSEQWKNLIDGKMPPFYEYQIIHAVTGEKRWINQRNVLVRDDKGQPTAIEGIARDITEEKNAEEALRQEKSFLDVVLSSLAGIFYVFNQQGKILKWNHNFEVVSGYTPEEISKMHPLQFFREEERAKILKTIEDVFANGKSFVEGNFVVKDGSTIPHLMTGARFELDGEPCLVGTGIDISKRVKAENQLTIEKNRAQNYIEGTRAGTWEWNILTGTKVFNKRWAEIIGYSLSEIEVKDASDFFDSIHPDDEPRVHEQMDLHLAGQVDYYDVEFRQRHKDGHWVWISSRGKVTNFDEDGNPVLVSGTHIDITDRKLIQEALEKEKVRVQSYIEGANAGTWEWNIQSGEIAYNEKWSKILGFTMEELEGSNVDDFLSRMHPEDQKEAEKQMGLHFSGEIEFYDAVFRYKHKDGHWLWINARGKLSQRTREGHPVLITGTYIDVTERKQLEDKMLQTQKMESLGILAGGIAHDFNNLLVGIIGGAELALMNLSPTSPGYNDIQTVISSAAAAADLSKQMLAYSGKGSFDIQNVDIREIINEMVYMLKSSISKQVILKTQYSDSVPGIKADITQVRQVIMNLVINASEAIGEKGGIISIWVGEIRCGSEKEIKTTLGEYLPVGQYVIVDIADTGSGMDKETITKLFDPFFTTKFTGRGLGLSAVQGIMHGHKGAVSIKSEPEKGSTFRLFFPALEKPLEPAGAASEHTNTDEISGTVLIVDDEESVRKMAERMLDHIGFDVLTVSNGRDAVTLYQEQMEKISFVLLDMTMPGMNGAETFHELRKIDPEVKVIIASGYSEQDIATRFSGEQLSGFCQKPFRYDTLKDTATKVLGL